MRLIEGRHISLLCADFEEMQPHGMSVWIVISEKADGVSKGAVAPFGTRPCLQGVVCYT